MYILNTTFIMHPDQRENFLAWMRSEAIAALFNAQSVAATPRLQTVVEVGGQAPDPTHGLSIALQAEFQSPDDAHTWISENFAPVAGKYTEKFGPHALFFQTLLETLPL